MLLLFRQLLGLYVTYQLLLFQVQIDLTPSDSPAELIIGQLMNKTRSV